MHSGGKRQWEGGKRPDGKAHIEANAIHKIKLTYKEVELVCDVVIVEREGPSVPEVKR